jgi:hypothetical protein
MKKEFPLTDRETIYFFLKKDFFSSYNNNGHNIELAIAQISNLRMIQKKYVESILSNYIKQLRIKLNNIQNEQ